MNFINHWQLEEKLAKNPSQSWSCTQEEEGNKVIVERSGFVPLSMRFKQMQMAGLQARIRDSQFDYQDYKDVYNDDEVFNYSDDLEEQIEKVNLYLQKLQAVHGLHSDEAAAGFSIEPAAASDGVNGGQEAAAKQDKEVSK